MSARKRAAQRRIPAFLGAGHRAFRARREGRGIAASVLACMRAEIVGPRDPDDAAAASRHVASREAFVTRAKAASVRPGAAPMADEAAAPEWRRLIAGAQATIRHLEFDGLSPIVAVAAEGRVLLHADGSVTAVPSGMHITADGTVTHLSAFVALRGPVR